MKMSMEESETGRFLPITAREGNPLKLAMQRLHLSGVLLPVGARLLVRHRFQSAERKKIEAVYSFLLPRDAALRRFEVQGDGFRVHSELKATREAVEQYEQGLADGHLSSLARQYGDGMVNLSLGNLGSGEEVLVTLEILAGVDVHDNGFRFRFPFSLAPAYHRQARIAEVRPGEIEMELPADLFGDLILPPFHKSAKELHAVSFDLALDLPEEVEEISSPSHALRVSRSHRISLAPASDLPDRDLVLDVVYRKPQSLLFSGKGEKGMSHFAAILSSKEFGETDDGPRSVVFLLDRSGSMEGDPLRQARMALRACLAVLRAEDRFGLVAFSDHTEQFQRQLVTASPENREAAAKFLDRIEARGGTELGEGIRVATALMHGVAGDVFLLTDGQVAETDTLLREARKTGCRLHTLGIGSASQDRFLNLLAGQTDGVCRFVTPRERVDQAALDLFAAVSSPIATGLKITGLSSQEASLSPEPQSSVFPGSPVLLFWSAPEGNEKIPVVEFTTVENPRISAICFESVRPVCGETLHLLRGARLITEAEVGPEEEPTTSTRHDTARRRQEAYLTRLSQEYSLAGPTMSLVAVIEREGDRPGEPPLTRVVPVGLPQDMQIEVEPCIPRFLAKAPKFLGQNSARPVHGSLESFLQGRSAAEEEEEMFCLLPEEMDGFDLLMDLSARLQPDGGMPGKESEDRLLSTLLTLLSFLAHGDSLHSGSFRLHIRRMMDYLEQLSPDSFSQEQRQILEKVIRAARSGEKWPGDWSVLAREVDGQKKGSGECGWKALREAHLSV